MYSTHLTFIRSDLSLFILLLLVSWSFQVRSHKGSKTPYVIAFVGINGVGKSTSLAKVCYYLKAHGVSCMMAACDTFRSGAVEQLRSHAACLDVPLFEKGEEREAGW
jgi:signal recognition particle receptor subunit alpha